MSKASRPGDQLRRMAMGLSRSAGSEKAGDGADDEGRKDGAFLDSEEKRRWKGNDVEQ